MPSPTVTAPRPASRAAVATGVTLWAAAVVGGFGFLATYGRGAGPDAGAPVAWPAASGIERAAGLQLVVFIHPHCPCTMASLAALDRTLVRAPAPVTTRVVVVGPEDPNARPRTSERAARIVDAEIVVDPVGAEATRFGAATSGYVALYADGRLRFSGGVTPSRGHEGTSSGCEGLFAALAGTADGVVRAPVFGCGLLERNGGDA